MNFVRGLSRSGPRISTKTDLSSLQRMLLSSENPPVHVAPSRIPGAGRGVFASRSIEEGEVLTWYPGRVFPLPRFAIQEEDLRFGTELWDAGDLPSKSYTLVSQYGGFVDAVEHVDDETPWKCGHLVNHPAPPETSNVETLHFRWTDVLSSLDLGEEEEDRCKHAFVTQTILSINRLHENQVWYYDVQTNERIQIPTYSEDDEDYQKRHYLDLLVGIAIVATRDISYDTHTTDPEELTLNYAYSDSVSKTLDWYHSVDR